MLPVLPSGYLDPVSVLLAACGRFFSLFKQRSNQENDLLRGARVYNKQRTSITLAGVDPSHLSRKKIELPGKGNGNCKDFQMYRQD